MNEKKEKQEWFRKIIDLREKKSKAEKASINASSIYSKASRKYIGEKSVLPDCIKEGIYTIDGYTISINEYDEVEVELTPKVEKL